MIVVGAQTQDPRPLVFGVFAEACRPRKRLTVSQWADAHRRLTPEASSEPGPWRTSRVPYLREIMDCLSVRSPVRRSCTVISLTACLVHEASSTGVSSSASSRIA